MDFDVSSMDANEAKEALLKLEDTSRNDINIDKISLLYLDGKVAKRTIGCPS